MEYSVFDKSRLVRKMMLLSDITDDIAECLTLSFGKYLSGEFIHDFIISPAGHLCLTTWKSSVMDFRFDIKCYNCQFVRVNNLLKIYELLHTTRTLPGVFMKYYDSLGNSTHKDFLVIVKFDQSQFTFKSFILTE